MTPIDLPESRRRQVEESENRFAACRYPFAEGRPRRHHRLDPLRNRYYNPKTGTFTQQDTFDQPLNPANSNRYAYAGNDPINNTGPIGQCEALGDCQKNGVRGPA